MKKKVAKLDWCGIRATDPRPIIYFSGHYIDESEHCKVIPITHRCVSFYSYENRGFKEKNFDILFNRGVGVFLDSGAFTLQQKRGTTWKEVKPFITKYCKFLDTFRTRLDWYATMDYQRNAQISHDATLYLIDRGYKAVPVYHGNCSLRWFEAMIDDGYPLIAIAKPFQSETSRNFAMGPTLRRFYDRLHNLAAKHNVALHGLAQTGNLMFEYPWYSVDSTSWLDGQRRGVLFIPEQKTGRILKLAANFRTVAEMKAGVPVKPDDWESIPRTTLEQFNAKRLQFQMTWRQLWEDYRYRNAFNMQAFQEYTNLRAKQTPRYSLTTTLL